MDGGSRCCYSRLSFSGDDAIAKYFSQEWWDSRTSSQKAVFNVAALFPAARVGGALWKGAQTVRGIRGASTAVSVVKRPGHELAVRHLANYQSKAAGWSLSKAHAPLTRALAVRKKLGMAALGYSAINPFQSIHYASKKDWDRLFWNIRYPIVGVPLYNLYQRSKGSGSPPSASPTGPKSRPGTKRRKFKTKFPKPGSPSSVSRQFEAGKRSKSWAPRRPSRCPPGHYWNRNLKRCVRYHWHKR